jgi:hypothetical protein
MANTLTPHQKLTIVGLAQDLALEKSKADRKYLQHEQPVITSVTELPAWRELENFIDEIEVG